MLESDADNVEVSQRPARLQPAQPRALLSHKLNGIKLRVVDTFAGGLGAGVYHVVKNLGAQVRHPYLVDVRVAQGELCPDLCGVLDHSINLAAQVPCRSLHLCQNCFR